MVSSIQDVGGEGGASHIVTVVNVSSTTVGTSANFKSYQKETFKTYLFHTSCIYN